jgi:hypothetical protein
MNGSRSCCGRGDAKAFQKYSQMKLQMKREALVKLNRMANEPNVSEDLSYGAAWVNEMGFDTALTTVCYLNAAKQRLSREPLCFTEVV